ncbi:MAG: 1-deoxy-D-xylulose-5-phosphate reductoisomerase [Dehalococcoidales bacterium]|jgi:1-deoxy-D-xylulose-5-phosphate reductoisomerase|nr:1-deoxy-D-xylulose-5-phosphate reductoisomerase [Dehalococcoidales bacterium]MDP7110163.1 1-deoxy-D-xylulose-5-phosphate reductoisomerase [Dehalococcoidales bacterium]MDP7309671.1 1-deoxy-D-xylulose-5-phosphate reductoisomerase [Dehalococcoidales bacterium]MDP7409396.1 1-deoxy-D-xylulose-5-phosphate reductoisomerase [Dehalococcoidales bacterium]MDP7675731.1 1-deoxy-D-xylulose-5-phosphate reductoisomerase [Dehalococcoidales bacterium]
MGSSVKKIVILGSTGSIGHQTLDVVRNFSHRFQIVGLAAGQNTDLLGKQINEFKPRFIYHEDRKVQLPGTGYEWLSLEDMACHPQVDLVVMAISGKAGLNPTLAAIKAGKTVALANKESLVTAGEIITTEAKRNGAQIFPIDSEHSAIWQCLRGETQSPAQIILTASGGPFRRFSLAELERVTVAQALKHPSWQMGKKVTIDSATLMNKGLEVIEAHWLFDMPCDSMRVVIHPQSIIHSMVEFADGSIKAQLGHPDMRLPIQYALSFPERLPNPQLPKLDWDKIKELTFEAPNFANFPCLQLAMEAERQGGTYPAVLCAADEVAVEFFLSQRIKFSDIARLVEQSLSRHQVIAHPNIEEIIAADDWARKTTKEFAAGVSRC